MKFWSPLFRAWWAPGAAQAASAAGPWVTPATALVQPQWVIPVRMPPVRVTC